MEATRASSLCPPAEGRPQTRLESAAVAPRGGIVFDDEEDKRLADRQRNMVRFVFTRLSSQLFSGSASTKSTSMPVHLNEARSFLQRLTDEFVYLDHFLDAASKPNTDPVLRINLVAGMVVASLHRAAAMAKCFNPHIGETFAAHYGPKDAPGSIYLEQTRHHPPVTHYYATPASKAYTMSGYASFDSSLRLAESALVTRRTGITTVDFGHDDRIMFNQPQFVVRGLLNGERRVEVIGPCSVFYEKHNLVLDLVFDPPQPFVLFGTRIPSDRVRGVLYRIEPQSNVVFGRAFSRSGEKYFGNPDSAFENPEESSAGDPTQPIASNTQAESDRPPVRATDFNIDDLEDDEDDDIDDDEFEDAHDDFADAVRAAPATNDPASASIATEQAETTDIANAEDTEPLTAVELRSDKDVLLSVTSAWDAHTADPNVDLATVPAPEGMSRTVLALASGSFVSHLDVGDRRVWDLETPSNEVRPMPLEDCLPSDSRHRIDVVGLASALESESAMNDPPQRDALLDEVQTKKEQLEQTMRSERKLRPIQESHEDGFFPHKLAELGR